MKTEASTSWMFAPAAALELSQELTSSSPAGAQSALLNGKNTRPGYLSSASESRRLSPSQSFETLPSSTDDHGLESWISSLVGRRASPTASPEKVSLKTTPEIYSQHSYAYWKSAPPLNSSWKTSGTLFPMTLTAKCSESSWSSGLILNGQLYRRAPLVETIKEIECGSMDGDRFATPTTKANQLCPSMMKHPSCRNIWPTPTSTERSGINPNTGRGAGLSTLVKFWPTPSANEPGWAHIQVVDKNGNAPQHFNQRLYDKKTGRLVQKGLPQAVKFWPTPSATERGLGKDKTLEPPKGEGSLNPAWVCAHLMNWPAGWDSLEPLPPNAIKEWKEKTLAGAWWSEEPDIPRIGKNIPDRAKRLKVLGNGMVPLCFAVAFEELSR